MAAPEIFCIRYTFVSSSFQVFLVCGTCLFRVTCATMHHGSGRAKVIGFSEVLNTNFFSYVEGKMAEPIMRKVKGEGVSIQVAIWEGKGKPILCIHGLTANCRCWDVIASELIPEHKVIAMDLRGRGQSDKPEKGYSIHIHCNDIRGVLEDLGLKPSVLMGHSLGAFISVVFASRYPEWVDSLILVDGGGKLNPEQFAKVFAGIKPSLDRLGKVFSSFEEYVGAMKQAPFLQPWMPALDVYYRYEVEELEGGKVRPVIRPETIDEESASLVGIDISDYYHSVKCPTLILRATEGLLTGDDLVLPEEAAQRMVKEIPEARLVNLEGTNHYTILFKEIQERKNAILKFLSKG